MHSSSIQEDTALTTFIVAYRGFAINACFLFQFIELKILWQSVTYTYKAYIFCVKTPVVATTVNNMPMPLPLK